MQISPLIFMAVIGGSGQRAGLEPNPGGRSNRDMAGHFRRKLDFLIIR